MSEPHDPTLVALGELERDYEGRHPGRWEAVLAGEVSPEEVAAERAAIDPPAEHAAFKDMFSKPTSEAELDALVERATQVLGAAAPAQVIPLARRRGLRAFAAAALALAAALLLWRFTATPLAAPGSYTLTLRDSAVSALRSSEGAPELRRYTLASELDWVLSPEHESDASLELRVLAKAPEGPTTLVTPVFTRSPAGALRIRGRVAEVLPLPVGRWRLVFLATPVGAAPTNPATAEGVPPIGRPIELELTE